MAKLDHLVIMARTLDEGVAWCEATLRITPASGGEHPLMGTHNRLLRIDSAEFPRAYLELVAINSEAFHACRTRARHWFDMDDARGGGNPAVNLVLGSPCQPGRRHRCD